MGTLSNETCTRSIWRRVILACRGTSRLSRFALPATRFQRSIDPDFVPVLGHLDDVIVVPLGILAVVKLIPPKVMAEHLALAAAVQDRPVSCTAAIVIAIVWVNCVGLAGWLGYRFVVS